MEIKKGSKHNQLQSYASLNETKLRSPQRKRNELEIRMDNLDISDSLSSSFPWLPYGASQFSDYQVNGDHGYFSQRSAMLEPIIEETSDDDDVSCGHVWTHNDNQWSSESEAGSVIRVELIQGNFMLDFDSTSLA